MRAAKPDPSGILVALWRRKLALALIGTLLVVAAAGVLFACSQTPTSVPVRTFERAQRMDVACLRVYDPAAPGQPLNAFTPREPIGRPEQECAPVPVDTDGLAFDKQLFAFVTQTQRGELAVVDLSAGQLIDQSRAIPGINFIPVGQNPTGVATTPDGKMVFVAAAETNKPAIYGIPTRRALGDTVGFPRDPTPPTLQSWPVCLLPQNPGAIMVLPRKQAVTADGGTTTSDAGGAGDAGTTTDGELPALYDIVVVLPGDRQNTAKVITLDPRPFRRAGLRELADGTPDYASDLSAGDSEVPTLNAGPNPLKVGGDLQPCSILLESAVELAGAAAVPAAFNAGPTWDDGVKYVEGGVDTTCKRPLPPAACGTTPCCAPISITGDGGVDPGLDSGVVDSGTCVPLGTADAGGPVPLTLGPINPPQLVSMARNGQTLYIADEGAPLIHVVDLTDPTAPREAPPLLATSLGDPSRTVLVKEVAISPPTRDYKTFLYAIDQADGSLMVYDITDPNSTQRTPLVRPHPELNPFQPSDRIGFSSPVVTVAFARHDFPLGSIDSVQVSSAGSGILCNPNPKLDPTDGGNPHSDLGYYYRADVSDIATAIGPRRLRGIFGFATLSTGSVEVLDVDDWDAPCRRPLLMDHDVSDIGIAQPASGAQDTSPYHAPVADPHAVTNEAFFPMSAPHTQRSSLLIVSDDVSGNNLPQLVTTPIISSNGVTLSQIGTGSQNTPQLSVGVSFEVPQVATDQDWAVVYEGVVPGFGGVTATVSTPDNYSSLVLNQPQAHFCQKGVEDWARGEERVGLINEELARRSTTLPVGSERWMTDYVQLSEDLLDVTDQYWPATGPAGGSCWEGNLADPPNGGPGPGAQRHDFCASIYGSLASDQKPTRDFPIVEAYDDHVVLGRFYTPTGGHREVVYTDPSNATDLKLMQCCFHRQVQFNVRTGQLWAAIGNNPGATGGLGFFSHLTTDAAGRCVHSCDPRDSLLNARIPTIPTGILASSIDRDSPLAMRSPLLTMVMLSGTSGVEPARDSIYTFSVRGGFQSLSVATGGTSTSVAPQSMRYVDSLGQMAVVDAQSQGLVLIDLSAVVLAHAPYF